jgi:hypothetical protein
LAITLLGSVLLLDRVGVLEIKNLVQYWPVLLTLFGISVVVQAIRGDRPGSNTARPIVGSGVILVWLFVWLAVSSAHDRHFVAAGSEGDAELKLIGVMGEDSRASLATAFRSAHMTSVMGRTRLDLRQAALAPDGTATVDVFGLMGAVEVLVPHSWTIDVQATTVMGGVRDRRASAGQDPDSYRQLSRSERRRLDRERLSEPVVLAPLPPAATPTSPGTAAPAGGAPAATASGPAADGSPATPPTDVPAAGHLILRGVVIAGGLIIRS